MTTKKKPPGKAVEIVGTPGCPANWGINYHPHGRKSTPEKRAEVGSVVADLPDEFRDYLLANGLAREVGDHG